MKSFRPKGDPGNDDGGPGRNVEREFRGEKRSNGTHASTTDSDARLCKKADGQPSRLCFVGTALMENRSSLPVHGRLTRALGVSECLSAVDLADQHIPKGDTLAGDKGFDTAAFVAELRDRRITRTSPRMPTTPAQMDQGGPSGGPTSTGARPGTPATPRARNAASASRRSLVG